MTGVNTYSTTPANNVNANTGINWDEGVAPAAVNNSARQNMTDLRLALNDLIWFQYGKGDLAGAPTYSSGTVFTQASSATLSAAYHVGRRVKAVGVSTGTIYGTISVTAFAASTQTVTVVWDSGSLSNESLAIYLSQIPVTGSPVSGPISFPGTEQASSNVNVLDDYEEGTWVPTDQSGASLSLTVTSAGYVKIGGLVTAWADITFPVTVDVSNVKLSLPFAATNVTAPGGAFGLYGVGGSTDFALIDANAATFQTFTSASVNRINSQYSNTRFRFNARYPAP